MSSVLWCHRHERGFGREEGCAACLRDALAALQVEVERYIEKPGCNLPSRKTAMERLRFALGRSRQ